jgi:hypothetical protein
MNRIDVIITHRDDKHDLEKCLKSVKETGNDFFLIDSINSQKARGICRIHKIKYLENELSVITSIIDEKNKNGSNDYVLIIGSNEFLSGGLKNNMAILRNTMNYDAYRFVILKNYYGRWMKHSGLYPNQEIRLFRKNMVTWTGNTIKLNPEGEVNATFGVFNGEIYCIVYSSIFDHINQINGVTEAEAEMLFNSGSKSNVLKIIFRPWEHFMQLFFIKLGFLDGYYGLVNAVLSAYSDFLLQVKLRFLKRMD